MDTAETAPASPVEAPGVLLHRIRNDLGLLVGVLELVQVRNERVDSELLEAAARAGTHATRMLDELESRLR
jgi:hypothetical protein